MASARQKRLRQPRSTSRQYALKIPTRPQDPDGQPTGMEPGFMPGEMIVVDPSRPVAPGCDVVASFNDHGAKPTMCMLRPLVRKDRWAVWLRRIAEPDTAAERFPMAAFESLHRIVAIGDWVD